MAWKGPTMVHNSGTRHGPTHLHSSMHGCSVAGVRRGLAGEADVGSVRPKVAAHEDEVQDVRDAGPRIGLLLQQRAHQRVQLPAVACRDGRVLAAACMHHLRLKDSAMHVVGSGFLDLQRLHILSMTWLDFFSGWKLQSRRGLPHDAYGDGAQIWRIKSLLQCAQLVQDAAQRPNISLRPVHLPLHESFQFHFDMQERLEHQNQGGDEAS